MGLVNSGKFENTISFQLNLLGSGLRRSVELSAIGVLSSAVTGLTADSQHPFAIVIVRGLIVDPVMSISAADSLCLARGTA